MGVKRITALAARLSSWSERNRALAFFAGVLGAIFLIAVSTVLPLAHRSDQLKQREEAMARQVRRLEGQRDSLQMEVVALEDDPYAVELYMSDVLRMRRRGEVPLSVWKKVEQR